VVLTCAPAHQSAAPLLRRLLASPTDSLQPLWLRSDWEHLRIVDLLAPAVTQ